MSYPPNHPGSPTVLPSHNFDAKSDAAELRKAMKGFGTDEKTIINVLTKRSNWQRLEIAAAFKTLYGKDLIKDLKSELSGKFEDTILALMLPLHEFYAVEVHKAISGLGTDESVLIEVFCSLSNNDIKAVCQIYQEKYKNSLEEDLKGDTSGCFRRLMVSLCNAGRDENGVVDFESARADAMSLKTAGVDKIGTDESTFNMILCQRSYPQLRIVFQEYEMITGHDFEKAIKSEFSGSIQDGLLAVVRIAKCPAAYFAKRLNHSVKGLGTNDRELIRLVVTRCEFDMGEIKTKYAAKYGESLAAAIRGDCSGDYKHCLLSLIGE